MMCRSSTNSWCFHTGHVCSPLLIRGCLPQTQPLSIILISNPIGVSLYCEYFFNIVKQRIKCIWLLYIKLLKQVETHLNTAYSLHCVRLSQIFLIKTTDRNSRLSLKTKSLILISKTNVVSLLNMLFSIAILFYHSTVTQSSIDIFTLNSINIYNVLNAFGF